jgi:hypothetical protein
MYLNMYLNIYLNRYLFKTQKSTTTAQQCEYCALFRIF